MKIFKLSFLSLATVALLSACGGETKSEVIAEDIKETKPMTGPTSYIVDTELSKVYWKGSMLGMYSHEGTLNFVQGKFTVNNNNLVDGSFVVDMSSMNPTDDGYNTEEGKTKEKLVGHLSSDDFFSVEKFPTASLAMKGGKMMLSVRDKSNLVKMKEIIFEENEDGITGKGSLTFDRKQYGVAFDHPAQEMVLSDDIDLTIEIIANPR